MMLYTPLTIMKFLQRIILCMLLIGWIRTSKITHFNWNRSLSEYVVWT